VSVSGGERRRRSIAKSWRCNNAKLAMSAEIKLLGYVASALFFFMAFMLLLTLRQTGRVRGARQWLLSTLVVAVGVALNTAQEAIAPILGLVASNVCIVFGALMSAHGTYEYRYHRVLSPRWGYAAIAGLVLLFAYFVYISPSIAARILLVALLTGTICALHAWVMLAGSALRPHARSVQHKRFRLPHGIMVFALLVMAAIFAIRFLDTIVSTNPALPPGGATRTAFAFYAVGLIGRLFLLIGMVLVLIDELDFELRALASRDALTGLFNRRGFFDAAAPLLPTNCSLLMLDLDQFKSINDEFGHDEGDRTIALFARSARASLPADAVLSRLGGEEFCALLPNTDREAAIAIAERLRNAFFEHTASLAHGRQHTVSIGVAPSLSTTTTIAQLVKRADRALYEAKRNGRNRVELARE
jgi:diguanylate cyclase (GGDEF)-like protein